MQACWSVDYQYQLGQIYWQLWIVLESKMYNFMQLHEALQSPARVWLWYLLWDATELIQSESRAPLEPNHTHKKLSFKHLSVSPCWYNITVLAALSLKWTYWL
jgi:hypothetical protein